MTIANGKKYPTQKAWPEKALLDPPYACGPASSTHLSTGILCNGLRPVDIDLTDPAQVETVLAYLKTNFGENFPIRYRPNSPRILALFAAEVGEPSKTSTRNKTTGQGVEVLGKGTQFHADGLHPSGVRLLWRDGAPDQTHRQKLIKLGDEQIEQLITFCSELIAADRTSYRPMSATDLPRPLVASQLEIWPIGDIADALDQIPNLFADYEYWFRVTAAVFMACAGSREGFQTWLHWSSQCSDFDTKTAERLWQSLYRAVPERISAGTLWWIAKDNDSKWDRPSLRGFQTINLFHRT